MKRLTAVILLSVVIACFLTGCGKDRILYSKTNLKEYVELSKYKGIEVNTESDTMKENRDNVIANDILDNDFKRKITEGTVKNGDTVNIDYIGRKNGIAFSGGTSKGYELEIGSGSFIDGFEEGLIGKEIGSTVDLNLKFPEAYDEASLAGAEVVFTVTINYIPTDEDMTPAEYYDDLGFESYEDYMADVEERAVKNYLLNYVISNSIIVEYPEKDEEILLNMVLEAENYNAYMTYKTDLETYVNNETGKTLEEYTEELKSGQVTPMMGNQLVFYSILDAEKMEIDKKAIKDMMKEELEAIGDDITEEQLLKSYGEYYFEAQVVGEQVYELIRSTAVIK